MKNNLLRALAATLCAAFLAGGLFLVSAVNISKKNVTANKSSNTEIPKTSGTTYYVDAAADAGNSGLSPEKALKTLEEVNKLDLKPGDQVLFKRDCRWNGALIINASGTKEAPIAYDVYGKGENAPILNANGMACATISGVDVSYIEIRNLEIMNESDESTYLRGIFINGLQKNIEGIKILNNYVHDVNSAPFWASERGLYKIGHAYNDYHWNGGIIVRAGGYAVRNEEEQVILNDILVENNRVESLSTEGITVGSITKSWKKSTNVIVRNNYVKDCGGDAILLFSCVGGVIEGNVCEANGWQGEKYKQNFVGVFIIYCDKTLIQYNEVFGQKASPDDSQAFDADDGCTNTLIQYNYSHDNYRGFLLMLNMDNNGNSIVRYNISQNDGGAFIHCGCKDSAYHMVVTAEVYNNVCYTNKSLDSIILIQANQEMQAAPYKRLVLDIYNNIFYYKGASSASALKVQLDNDNSDYVNFSNNCWYGLSERNLPQNEKGRIIGDPKFSYPGSGKLGLDTLTGYQLLKNSPCLNAGKQTYNNGGLDYYGSTVADKINIGAYIGDGVGKPKNVNLALTQKATMSSVNAIAMLRATTYAKLTDGSNTETVLTELKNEPDTEWIEVDLEDTYDVSRVVLFAGEDTSLFPKDFTIEIWNGTEWKQVKAQKNYEVPEDVTSAEFTFKAVSGSKVRINITGMRQNSAGKYAAGISEIEVYQ